MAAQVSMRDREERQKAARTLESLRQILEGVEGCRVSLSPRKALVWLKHPLLKQRLSSADHREFTRAAEMLS